MHVMHAIHRLRERPSGKLTYEEFLAWCDEDTWAEWVDGEVIRPAPFQMKTRGDLPGREPDLLFVSRAHAERLQTTYLDGPADVAVEVVSPESGPRDRGEQFYEDARKEISYGRGRAGGGGHRMAAHRGRTAVR